MIWSVHMTSPGMQDSTLLGGLADLVVPVPSDNGKEINMMGGAG